MRNALVKGTLYGCSFVRVYLLDREHITDLTGPDASEFDYIFAYSLVDLGEIDGFSRERKLAQIIALNDTEEDVFGSLHKTNRKKIRRTYRDHEVQIVVDDGAREDSLDFYRAIKQAEGVSPDFPEDFASVRWINAYHRGELITSTSWYQNEQVLRGKHYVSVRKQSAVDTALIGRLTRRLFWEACALGLKEGMRYVDLGGLDPHDPSKRGISDFKRSFGGETVDMFIYRRSTASWLRLAEEISARGVAVL